MFVQVIEGTTRDPEALHRQLEVWERDLRPGAVGYLGSAGGVTASGACVLIARFESEEAARRNSDRPEQSAWWEATEACFDGPVTFHDTADVEIIGRVEPEGAGFMQVMDGHVTDRGRAHELEAVAEDILAEVRPEILGTMTVFYDDDGYTQVAYFTSEDDARRGESQEVPAEAAQMMGEWDAVMKVDRYLDIADVWVTT